MDVQAEVERRWTEWETAAQERLANGCPSEDDLVWQAWTQAEAGSERAAECEHLLWRKVIVPMRSEVNREAYAEQQRIAEAQERTRKLWAWMEKWEQAGIEYGKCLCGCGQTTPKYDDVRNSHGLNGLHWSRVNGHSSRVVAN